VLDDDETEVFVTAADGEEAAGALRKQFMDGFLSYGKAVQVAERAFVVDRYLGSYSTAEQWGALVYGVRGAPDADAATSALDTLLAAARGLPPEALAAARASLSESDPSRAGE
jgi:hypothetical protein